MAIKEFFEDGMRPMVAEMLDMKINRMKTVVSIDGKKYHVMVTMVHDEKREYERW